MESIRFDFGETRPESVAALIAAFETDGALPALKDLCLECKLGPGAIPRLARALASGKAPLLTDLSIYYCNDSDLDALADMMEARARLHGCRGLDFFHGGPGGSFYDRQWFDCFARDADSVGARPAANGDEAA